MASIKKRAEELYYILEEVARSEGSEICGKKVDYKIKKKQFVSYFCENENCDVDYPDDLSESCVKINKTSRNHLDLENVLLDDKKFLQKSFGFSVKPDTKQLEEQVKINGETLLFRALSIPQSKDDFERNETLRWLIHFLINGCPKMIKKGKKVDINEEKTGITPLHLAVLLNDEELLRLMIEKMEEVDIDKNDIDAKGLIFDKTVMMAGTPVGVAALSCNRKILKTLLENGFALDVVNQHGDNIIHSLIKYAYLRPAKQKDLTDMLKYILGMKWNMEPVRLDQSQSLKGTVKIQPTMQEKKISMALLMYINEDGFTPLQLAVKRQQYEMFEIIMKSDVYCSNESSNCLIEANEYDISEIDTVSQRDWDPNRSKKREKTHEHHESILEYIVHLEPKLAFLFSDFFPVRAVIKNKWKTYRWVFGCWFLFHIIVMVLLTVGSVERSRLYDSPFEAGNVSDPGDPSFVNRVTKDVFVTYTSAVGFIVGLLYIFLEIAKLCFGRFKARISVHLIKHYYKLLGMPYSNCLFRVNLVLFSVLLVIDFIIAVSVTSWYENNLIIFALLLGWYQVLFFVQTIKLFSFFTVLIQRVLSDLAKFSIVMGIFLVAFSSAMFMIMQGAQAVGDDFRDIGKTFMKMLTIMLGIGEIDVLFQARQPFMAVTVFVLFVLLTTILLLNALIAMMSNTCTDLTKGFGDVVSNKMHCRLQKLSVILFLEGLMPLSWCKKSGVLKNRLWFKKGNWSYVKKPMISKNSAKEFEDTDADKIDEVPLHRRKRRKRKLHPIPISTITYPQFQEHPDKGYFVTPLETYITDI